MCDSETNGERQQHSFEHPRPRPELPHRGSAPRVSFEYPITAHPHFACAASISHTHFAAVAGLFVHFVCLTDLRFRSRRRTATALLRTSHGQNFHTGEVRHALLVHSLIRPIPMLLPSPTFSTFLLSSLTFCYIPLPSRLANAKRAEYSAITTSNIPRPELSHRGSAPRASFECLITANTIPRFRRQHFLCL